MSGKKLIQTTNIWPPFTNYVFSAGLLWYTVLGSAQDGYLKYTKIWASVEKSEIWNIKSWLVSLIIFVSTIRLQG